MSAVDDAHRGDGPAPLSSRAVTGLRRSILGWYQAHGRTLRIRTTTDPWAVLVAEMMAHQTQIERVDAAWAGFLERFPSARALAEAGPGEAVRAWQGLGYNRRAVNLYRAASVIVEEHGGHVPDDLACLEALPGVGRYTARAVAATAFGRPVGAVDTNVRRVLTRIAGGADAQSTSPALQATADAVVPPRAAAAWTHALMDLGALVCRRTAPRCEACPAARWCRYAAGAPATMPGPAGAPARRPGSGPSRPAIRFEQTTRWLRGRIVDRLREMPPGVWLRFDGPVGEHDARAVVEALAALERDGIVVLDAADQRSARLPGA